MKSPVNKILRNIDIPQKLNILTACTHERYETGLAKTGHNFYAIQGEHIKDWKTIYAPRPDNYYILSRDYLPEYLDFDLVLSQNKFGQYQRLAEIAQHRNIPLISLEHTLPMNEWPISHLQQLRQMRGHLNIFISEYSVGRWGWISDNSVRVIHHMVDTSTFYPINTYKQKHILSVVNDWINRDWCCGFNLWKYITKDLPVYVLGDTQGLSRPASTINELVKTYQTSRIFLNTSIISPVPTALLEAMACGCAIVSTATCMIPEIIQNGVNGFVSNTPDELIKYCKLLLNDEKLAISLGEKARDTILDKFNETNFIKKWNSVFKEALSYAS